MVGEILEDLGELRKKFLGREHLIKRLINIATEHSPKQIKFSSPREAALKTQNDYLQAINKMLTEDLENATNKFLNTTNIDSLSPRTESLRHFQPGLLNNNQVTPLTELDKLLAESQKKNEIYSRKLTVVSICIQRFLNAIKNLQKGVAKPDGQMERLRKEFELNKVQLLFLLEDSTRIDELPKEDICSKLPKFGTSSPDQVFTHSIVSHSIQDLASEDFLPPQFQSIFQKTKDEYGENIHLLEKQINEYKTKLEQQKQINAKLLKEKEYSSRKFSDSNQMRIQEYDVAIENYQKNELNFTQIIKTLKVQMQEKNEALEIYKENSDNREKKILILKSKMIRLIKNFGMVMLQRFTIFEDFIYKKIQSVDLINEKVRKNRLLVRSELVEESQILEYRKRDRTKQEVRITELSSAILELKKKLKEQCRKYLENQKNLTEIITDTQREARELRRALQAAQEELIQKQSMIQERDIIILKASTTDSKNSSQNNSLKNLSKQLCFESKLKQISISAKKAHKFSKKSNIEKSQKIFMEFIPQIQEKLEEVIKMTLTKISEAVRMMKEKIQKISYTQSVFIVHKENEIKQ